MRRLWCLSRVHIINTPSVPSLIRIQLRLLRWGDAGVGPRLKFTSAKMFFPSLNIAAALVLWNECSKTTIHPSFTPARQREKELAYFQAWFSSSGSQCNRGALRAKYCCEMMRDELLLEQKSHIVTHWVCKGFEVTVRAPVDASVAVWLNSEVAPGSSADRRVCSEAQKHGGLQAQNVLE